MPQELVDESENRGLKMNKLKAKAMMKNNTPIYVNYTQTENIECYIYLPISPETKTKSSTFKEESRPDEQHSPSTVIYSWFTLEHA